MVGRAMDVVMSPSQHGRKWLLNSLWPLRFLSSLGSNLHEDLPLSFLLQGEDQAGSAPHL